MISPTALLVAATLFIYYIYKSQRRRAKLPPGPPRLPIIGNLHQAPSEAVWVKFQEWVDKYGPLVSVDFGGTEMVIIGDYEIAKDLLDRRANVYSSRPRLVMAQELVCANNHIMFRPFDSTFLLHQRLEAPVLSPRASACYTPIQDLESKALLNNLLASNDFGSLYERFSASIVYTLTFGFRIITGDEWQLHTSDQCLKNFTASAQAGAWIVDTFPFLNILPKVIAPWKKTAEKWNKQWDDLHMNNMRSALERPGWNWSKDFRNAREAKEITEIELAWDLGILCDAGVETTNVTLRIFTLACIAFPEWVSVAQKEIDDVVGKDRLPEFEDMERLVYLQAVVEENFRWRHLAPAGLPHATTQDDWYKGYLIPKGAIITPLFTAMRHDKSLFDSPHEFRPGRWLGKTQSSNFGYGRRICPGRFIARNSLLIAMARILWAFNIKSKNGKRAVVDESYFTTGFVSHPKGFDVVFEVRSEERRMIVEKQFQSAEKDTNILLEQVRKNLIEGGITPRA